MGSRRASISSVSSGSSGMFTALDSSSPLILVNDDEESSAAATPFDFSSDDEADDPPFQPFVQPLNPSTVFLYLLSPYLKFGAMLLPHTGLPLKFGIPALIGFALLSAFSRQVWYMLARYFCKPDFEEVLLEVLASGRSNERRRRLVRSTVRGTTALLRILLATLYLRECTKLVISLFSDGLRARPLTTILLSVFLLPFTLSKSLASRPVIYATWLSVLVYLFWFGCTFYAHARGVLQVQSSWVGLGVFWQGITATAFTFTSSSTLSLYASLKAGTHPIPTIKSSTTRSFRFLSTLAISIAVALTVPLTILAAFPNDPVVGTVGLRLGTLLTVLEAATLLLGIPSILATTPSFPMPKLMRRSTIPLSKLIAFLVTILSTILPTSVSRVLSDTLIVCALFATYFAPALVHITTHFVRRPLSIIMPSTPNPFTPMVDDSEAPSSANDPLLQRKERAMQQRQFRRRIIWHIGVWLVLLPLAGWGGVWAFGRLTGRW